jgi:hypothetical protein
MRLRAHLRLRAGVRLQRLRVLRPDERRFRAGQVTVPDVVGGLANVRFPTAIRGEPSGPWEAVRASRERAQPR